MGGFFIVLTLVAFLLSSTGGLAQAADPAGHLVLTPEEMKWAPGPPSLAAGAKILVIEGALANPGPFTFRLLLPAGYKIAPHWHPAIEHVTVLSGTFNIGMGEIFDSEKLKALPAGSIAFMQPKTPHFVLTKEETIIQVHGVGPSALNYVNPEDDPRKK